MNGDGFVIENERPERDRLADEIMKVLINRQTSLADGINALTTMEINVLKDNYEGARANEFNLLCADFYEHVTGFSESMKNDCFYLIPRKGFVEDAEHVVVKRDRAYFASAKRLWHRIGQAVARGGTNLRSKLGQGGGAPEQVRPLAIEIRELLSKRRTSRTTSATLLMRSRRRCSPPSKPRTDAKRRTSSTCLWPDSPKRYAGCRGNGFSSLLRGAVGWSAKAGRGRRSHPLLVMGRRPAEADSWRKIALSLIEAGA
jgi:hypothetical protein